MKLSTLAIVALVCQGVDDTAAMQQAMDSGDQRVELSGSCAVNGIAGVKIPSDRKVNADAATVWMLPGCPDHCKLFETVVGAKRIEFTGGVLRGDLAPLPYGRWRNLWRVDSAEDVVIRGTQLEDAAFDAIWIGGNAKSRRVVVDGVRIRNFGRSGISIVNATRVTVERSDIAGAFLPTVLGAGIDIEPNYAPGLGEWVDEAVIRDNVISDVVHGVYDHTGKGKQGSQHQIIGNTIQARDTGVVVNSVQTALVYRNNITAGRLGLSVGSSGIGALAEAWRAYDILAANNTISAPRGVVLAGCRDSRIVGNEMGGGRVETVVLGSIGRMTVEAPYEPVVGVCTNSLSGVN